METLKDIAQLSHQVRCANPRIIINPSLPELLAKYGECMLNGKYIHWKKSRISLRYKFPYGLFSVKRNGITKDNIDESFVIDFHSGETFPVYMEVPCNHCNICKMRKVNSFVQRCELETCSYDYKPWFVTLTYDQEHVPADGVSVDHAQKFLKRLRINLVRAGFSEKIRYVIVGEYGKNTKRPHYHALIWNIQAKTLVEYKKVTEIIDRSWHQGYIQRRLVNPDNNASFYYTAKYLRKDNEDEEGRNKTFCNSSNRGGGIGSRFIDNVAEEIRKTLNTDFKYFNKWQGKVKNLYFSQYILNRVLPSFCRSIPSEFRSAVASFALAFSKYKVTQYISIKQEKNLFADYYAGIATGLESKHGAFIWAGPIDTNKNNVLFWDDERFPDDVPIKTMEDCLTIINKYDINRATYERANRLHALRQVFMAKLFANQDPIDIDYTEWKNKTLFEAYAAKETL